MYYAFYIFVILAFPIVLLCVTFFLKNKKKSSAVVQENKKKDENFNQYKKGKYQKIKAQYYRGIEVESSAKFLSEDYRIVGLQEPKGKWTKMVMKQNIGYISTLKNLMGNNFSKMGFWQLKVKAQSLISQAMQKGKGR